jgi:hypothetical protein
VAARALRNDRDRGALARVAVRHRPPFNPNASGQSTKSDPCGRRSGDIPVHERWTSRTFLGIEEKDRG